MNAIIAALGGLFAFAAFGATVYLGIGVRRRLRDLDRKIERGHQLMRRLEAERTHSASSVETQISELAKSLGRRSATDRQRFQEASRDSRRRLRDIRDRQLEMVAATGLGGLNVPFPLFFGSWAIDSLMGQELVQTVEDLSPAVIVELGSGTSSVLIAATLKYLRLENTRHIIVDHEAKFLEHTRRRVALLGPVAGTEFWHCPLGEGSDSEPPWYSGVEARLGATAIDLLFVDGPPGKFHPMARRPAFGALREHLSDRAIVILDDTNRRDEGQIVAVWRAENPDFDVHVRRRGKGAARFVRRPVGEAPSSP